MSERPEVPRTADERATLTAMLAWLRNAVVRKATGVDRETAQETTSASGLDLLGIVHHLGYVERWWFRWSFAGEDVDLPWPAEDPDADPDADFRLPPDWSTYDVLSFYREECAAADAAIATALSLDELCVRGATPTSLRWVLLHVIRETARHAGHADLFREHIDGLVGE